MARPILRAALPGADSDPAVPGGVPDRSPKPEDVMLKLLHTADWHLGKRFPSFPEEAQKKRSRARMEVVERILELARRNQVNAVLCAGEDLSRSHLGHPRFPRAGQPRPAHPGIRLGPRTPVPRPAAFLGPRGGPGRLRPRDHAGRRPLCPALPVQGRRERPGAGPARPRARRHAAPHRLRPWQHLRRRGLPDELPDQPGRRGSARARLSRHRRYPLVSRRHGEPAGPDRLPGDSGAGELRRDGRRQGGYRGVAPARLASAHRAGDGGALALDRRAVPRPERSAQAADPSGPRTPRREAPPRHDGLAGGRERARADPARPPGDRRHPWPRGRPDRRPHEPAAAGRLRRHLSRRPAAGARGHRRPALPDRRRRAGRGREIESEPGAGPSLQADAASERDDRTCAMKIHRLRVESFAAIREVDVAFGPGLNVLYGPNDLGKSTLSDAIRLALLLPHTSSHCHPYIPWSGGQDPVVDLTFQTGEQRFWRVRKQFGKGGSSTLQESRNGQDFEEVMRARLVDAKLRELLGWGIPEPGGSGTGRSFPSSFLATALLSTQADVTAVLDSSLQDDPAASGKERIAAALQAAAQDPLFVALLRETQGRRDEAFTEKGMKKTARGSVFKAAADRVREAREEKDQLQKIVDDSEGVERTLRDLSARRDRQEQECAAAADHLETIERLAGQAADRDAAGTCAGAARDAVLRIRKMDQDVADAETRVAELAAARERAQRALADAQAAGIAAEEALKTAEGAARSAELESKMADTVARQALELRKG